MPNKRKTGKTVVSLWLDEEERKTLEKAARELGKNYSDFIRYAMQEVAKRRGLTDTDNTEKENHEQGNQES